MKTEISLKDLLETTFTINEDGEMVGEIPLKRINMIANIITNQQERIDKALNLIYNEDLSYYPNEEELVKILRGDKE